MPKLYPPLVYLLFLAFLIPNLYVIIVGTEKFPFSNNPMFGHYVTPKDSLVTFSFILEDGNIKKKLDLKKINLWEVRTLRYYYSNVYGASDKSSPQASHFNEEKFLLNNLEFFRGLAKHLNSQKIDFDKLHLALEKLDSNDQPYSSDTIGTYFTSTDQFVLR